MRRNGPRTPLQTPRSFCKHLLEPLEFFRCYFRCLDGWGTWIRTRTNGVRVRGSTVNLFPSAVGTYATLRQRSSMGVDPCWPPGVVSGGVDSAVWSAAAAHVAPLSRRNRQAY